jgi:hypothetical protein
MGDWDIYGALSATPVKAYLRAAGGDCGYSDQVLDAVS